MSKGHVLFVEDDVDVADTLRIYFTIKEYEVTIAKTGGEGLEQCRRKLPHVIVLDIMLPDMDGYEVCKRLRSHRRTSHVPIIFLTQKDERMDKIAGLSLGADDYVTKPFDMEELRLRVHGALQRAARDSLTNAVTGLPGNKLIEEQTRILQRKPEWGVLRITIEHLKAFSDKYGFIAGNEVLRFAALLMSEVVEELGTPDDFIGHTGWGDFIIISAASQAKAVAKVLAERFKIRAEAFYDVRDRHSGYLLLGDQRYPLMTLAIELVLSE
jgi:DNA-binding response OmpR family regulator